ncbi:Sortase family protein [Streptomyces sp. ADI96-02]|uniref:class E sortase n=1 Tax=Streptomyces sp. ADI96-02 TaxID=1522760 RepID=UPI000F550997|nr:class E sortase [Streptomyces sp. ADI96-02]RPK62205.1 Sortase family protein [Streptomyces sp. ADI96-02]
MTAGRPERDAGREGPYAQGTYGADGAYVAAVDGLADPLNDPLPGQHASPWFRSGRAAQGGSGGAGPAVPGGVPPAGDRDHAYQAPRQPQEAPSEWYDPEGYQRDWCGPQRPAAPAPGPAAPAPEPAAPMAAATAAVPAGARPVPAVPAPRPAPPAADETAVLPAMDAAGPDAPSAEAAPATGGRAERRRAAKGRGRRRTGPAAAPVPAPAAPMPMSRMEARRAARAAKDSPAVVASRAVGEVFITLGVLMLLFVTYQLWWTNIRAEQIAGNETDKIQDDWANGARSPGVFAPGQGFAIMHIPKLDVVAPIAEGIDKEKVLDRGMIGHYGEGRLKTAMPSDKQGNFAVAGHRNTHGEPFRYINKLSPGDPIVIETRDAYYTYEMASILPQTSPSNISVIEPVPVGSGFEGPGRYITLTTCTPEFTSTYRLIVWGKMVDERPRSKGKPDALVGG